MTQSIQWGLLAITVLLGVGVLFTGGVAAEEAELDEMVGDGTEDNPYVITDVDELQAMEQNYTYHYVLANDIDASDTATWEGGAGFDPIGDRDDFEPFVGSFDGNGYTISNLKIDRPSEEGVGLFGYSEGTVENVDLENADISGGTYVGSVVGYNAINEDEERVGTVREVSVTGDVQGTDRQTGGVIGANEGSLSEGSFVGDVEGTDYSVGGVVGWNDGPVSESYAAGTVEGEGDVGGIVGNNEGPVRASFFAGDVTGEFMTGGLAGENEDAFNNAYAHAHIESEYNAGGLFGTHTGTVTGAYAAGSVSSDMDAGGLISENDGIVNNAYWDVETTGQSQPFAVDEDEEEFDDDDEIDITGLDMDELTGENVAETTDLDFDFPWQTTDEYPRFQWEDDRDIPDEAYDVTLEPVDAEEEEEDDDEADPEELIDDDDDDDGPLAMPGFGVATAIVALVAAIGLVGRRV